jgi:hypothetical protein
MKLKINLTRGGKGEAVAGVGAEEERGESSNNNKKEKRNSKERKKTKKDSLTKPPKEKKKDKKTEKDVKAAPTEDEATKLTSSSKKQLPLLRSSHSKNPVPPSEPEAPTSPRGAAVSKWEQALRNEEKSKSPAADSTPSNHQRYATTTGAAPAAPTISPLDLSAEAGTSARITPSPPKALFYLLFDPFNGWCMHRC